MRMLALLPLLVASSASAAPRPPAPASASAPAWHDGVMDDKESCFVSRDYPGGARLTVLALRSGLRWLAVGSPDWKVQEPAERELRYELGGRPLSPVQGFAVVSAGSAGFISELEGGTARRMARGGVLRLRGQDGAEGTAFDVSGAKGAFARLQACHRRVAAGPGSGWEPAWDFRFDPFRLDAAYPRRAVPTYLAVITNDDYPSAAIRAEEQGVSLYRLDVGPNGRASGCTITGSSGSPALDSATCRLLRSRLRFRPARDAEGTAIADTFSGKIVWRMPDS